MLRFHMNDFLEDLEQSDEAFPGEIDGSIEVFDELGSYIQDELD
jgi:hypothetical protein